MSSSSCMQHPFPTGVVFLTTHEALLTARGRRFPLFLSCAFFCHVLKCCSHNVISARCSECQRGVKFKQAAFLWLRALQLCYLGGHALESGEIIGTLKMLKDGMPEDLADSLKSDAGDRKTDHAPLVTVTENEEIATLTATIETNLRQGDLETWRPPLQATKRRPSLRRSARRAEPTNSGVDRC